MQTTAFRFDSYRFKIVIDINEHSSQNQKLKLL